MGKRGKYCFHKKITYRKRCPLENKFTIFIFLEEGKEEGEGRE